MIIGSANALMLLLLASLGIASDDPRALQMAQVTVRQQIIIRVHRGMRPAPPPGGSLVQWRESRGPDCVPARAVAGATSVGRNSVDMILRDNSRVRARLERGCQGLDYYNGFYVDGTADGMICADRDSIRSRMGGACEIDQFRTLRASRP